MIDIDEIQRSLLYYSNEECTLKLGFNNVFNEKNLPVMGLDVPRLNNTYDCGIYLLQNVESFYLVRLLNYYEIFIKKRYVFNNFF